MTQLVSILTPSFNQARWLTDNLRSVADQTYSYIEQIVMDGGSTDGSISILEHAGRHVRWRSGADRGQSHALNKAFGESKGEIIAWLNSDDTFADRRTLEWVVDAFQRWPEADVVYGHVLDTTDSDQIIRVTWCPPVWVHKLHPGVNAVKQPGAFLRRRALERGFVREDLHFSMDAELFARLRKEGVVFRRLDRVLSTNRHQLSRKSLDKSGGRAAEFRKLRGLDDGRDLFAPEAVRFLLQKSCRVVGAKTFLFLPSSLEAASPLIIPRWTERLKLQLLARTEKYLLTTQESGREQYERTR